MPTGSYSSSNYYVDVVYAKSLVSAISPADTTTNVPTSSSVTVTFSTTMNASTINSSTVELLNSSGVVVPATVTYNATTQVATLTPSSPLTGGSTYTVDVVVSGTNGVKDSSGNALPVDVRAAFTTVSSAPTSYTVFGSTAPGLVDSGDTSAVQLGSKFQSTTSGFVTGIRFYKAAGPTPATHIGYLWSSSGTLLAQVTFSGETASGWQQANLSTPVYIQANTTYVVSYLAPKGHYSDDVSYFATKGATNGPLTELANGTSGTNGVYLYGTKAAIPTGSYSSSNYYVDVVFVNSLVSSITPAAAATAVSRSTTISVVFSSAMNAATLTSSTVILTDSTGKTIAASLSYNATTKTLGADTVSEAVGIDDLHHSGQEWHQRRQGRVGQYAARRHHLDLHDRKDLVDRRRRSARGQLPATSPALWRRGPGLSASWSFISEVPRAALDALAKCRLTRPSTTSILPSGYLTDWLYI